MKKTLTLTIEYEFVQSSRYPYKAKVCMSGFDFYGSSVSLSSFEDAKQKLMRTIHDYYGAEVPSSEDITIGVEISDAERENTIEVTKTEDMDTYNLSELRHIAANFSIYCERGYAGSFDDWFKKISPTWREIANRKV